MSPRWFDGQDNLALDTGGGPLARLWATALAGLVDIGYIKATGTSVQINLPKTALKGPVSFEWNIPQWSNTLERNRARTYFQAYAAAAALHFAEKALEEIRAGRTKTWETFEVPDEAISCGFTEAVRGVLSHHMVIRDGKIANYHPYPPTPWNASPTDSAGVAGPYEDAVQGQPIFEENDREHFKGIDIMRTVRSFDPCLPCGVHMYLGNGQTLETAALTHPDPDRRVTAMHGGDRPRQTGDRIGTLLDALGAGGAVARGRAEDLVRAGDGPVRLRAWNGSWKSSTNSGKLDDGTLAALTSDDLVSGLLVIHGLHPAVHGDPGGRGAGQRPALPGLPWRRRRTDGHQPGGRGAAEAARHLPGLPVVVRHAQVRRRGGHRIRRAGGDGHRGRRGGKAGRHACVDPGGRAAGPDRTSPAERQRPGMAGRTMPAVPGNPSRRSPGWNPATWRASWSAATRCWPAGPGRTCTPTATTARAAPVPWRAPRCSAPSRHRSAAACCAARPAARHFDVRQAGACLEDRSLHLDPLPLLVRGGVMSVAVPVASGQAG